MGYSSTPTTPPGQLVLAHSRMGHPTLGIPCPPAPSFWCRHPTPTPTVALPCAACAAALWRASFRSSHLPPPLLFAFFISFKPSVPGRPLPSTLIPTIFPTGCVVSHFSSCTVLILFFFSLSTNNFATLADHYLHPLPDRAYTLTHHPPRRHCIDRSRRDFFILRTPSTVLFASTVVGDLFKPVFGSRQPRARRTHIPDPSSVATPFAGRSCTTASNRPRNALRVLKSLSSDSLDH